MNDQPIMSPQIASQPTNNRRPMLPYALSLLCLVVAGVFGYLWWQSSQSSTSSVEKTPIEEVAKDAETELAENTTDATTLYKNETYGFSFVYPESWGDVDVKETDGILGKRITGTFSNHPNAVQFSAASTDYEVGGRDGGCMTADYVTVWPDATIDTFAVEDGENSYTNEYADKPEEYNYLNKTIESDERVLLREGFEAGQVDGPGACLGYYAVGVVIDPLFTQTNGLLFSLSTPLNQATYIYPTTIDTYKADPSFFFDSALRDGFISLVKSVKAL